MDKRIFPCIDIMKSGTRKEELLLDAATKERWWAVRQTIARCDTTQAMEIIKGHLYKNKTNAELLKSITT